MMDRTLGLIGWKIVDGDGHDEERYEGEVFESEDEAKDVCDYLHDKYDIDATDPWGAPTPWFVPVAVFG